MNYCSLYLYKCFDFFLFFAYTKYGIGGGGGAAWQKEDDWTLVDVDIRYGHFRTCICLSI